VSIELVVEVLDRYHGPDARKLWLLAWAEKANDRTRQGWPGQRLLAHRTGKSASRVSHIADELIGEGIIKRVGGGGRHRGETRYELLPLTAADDSQVAARTQPETDLRLRNQGSQVAESGLQVAPVSPLPAETPHNPQNPQEPSSARARGHGRAGEIIRSAFPDATDDEIAFIIKDRADHGARSLRAVLRHEIGEGTLRLPCDRDGSGRHSEACRAGHGDPRGCGMGRCACRCHTEPAKTTPAQEGTTP